MSYTSETAAAEVTAVPISLSRELLENDFDEALKFWRLCAKKNTGSSAASLLIKFYLSTDKAAQFISWALRKDIAGNDMESGAILRNTNSFAVNLLLALANTASCRSYLHQILSGIVRVLDHGSKKEPMLFVEVAAHARALCAGFAASAQLCPVLIRAAFGTIAEAIRAGDSSVFSRVVESTFFLHFICPALLQPVQFDLLPPSRPSPSGMTNIVNLTKMLQCAANASGWSSWTDETSTILKEASALITQGIDALILSESHQDCSESSSSEVEQVLAELQQCLQAPAEVSPSSNEHVSSTPKPISRSRRKSESHMVTPDRSTSPGSPKSDRDKERDKARVMEASRVQTLRRESTQFGDSLSLRLQSTSLSAIPETEVLLSSPPLDAVQPRARSLSARVSTKSQTMRAKILRVKSDAAPYNLEDLPGIDDEEEDETVESDGTRKVDPSSDSSDDEPRSISLSSTDRQLQVMQQPIDLRDEDISSRVSIKKKSKLIRDNSEGLIGSDSDTASSISELSGSDSGSKLPTLRLAKSSSADSFEVAATRHSVATMPIRRGTRSQSSSSATSSSPKHQGTKIASKILKRTLKDIRERSFSLVDVLDLDSKAATLLVLVPSFDSDGTKRWIHEAIVLKPQFERVSLRLIFVGAGTAVSARLFCSRTGCPYEVFVDTKGKLFRDFGCSDNLSSSSASPTMGNGHAQSFLYGWFVINGKHIVSQHVEYQLSSAKSILEMTSKQLFGSSMDV